MFLFTGASAIDIYLSNLPSEASFVIFKDSNLSDNVLILFVLCKLVLFSHKLHYTCFIYLLAVTLHNYLWTNHYILLLFVR